ncbi:MAG TPA: NAD(P)/FAD-dependent oxidoreductase [Clostridiales bacterium]|jgi:glycerol-3-phosphate dehydrogenase|nr:NAD(P)/FAD-dependent oxidoreductase [Clostridiales bacterium]
MYDIVIIGAGIAGSFIARELSRFKLKILIVDRQNDVGNETTEANSAIIHAGYDAMADQLKGKFNAPGNKMFDTICDELDVPFKRIGSLVLGFNEDDRKTIQNLYNNGLKNNVPDMRILEKDEILQMEPKLNEDVVCALYAPTAGIIGAWEFAIASVENAMDNGVELELETEVTGIEKENFGYRIYTNKGEKDTKYIINCAGVYADVINNMVTEPYFSITPRKGNYYVLDKGLDLVNHIIFLCPTDKGKGVIITPTVHGNILIGPDSEFVNDKDSTATDVSGLRYVKERALLSSKAIPFNKVIRTFAGLRAHSDRNDFIIEEAKGAKGFINVAGFESPGLSAIPAVAQYVVNIMQKLTGGLIYKDNFNPRRRKTVCFNLLSDEEKKDIIKKNPMYGNIICRCETVTEAEIVDAINRNCGARSVKAVKKRTRAGMGRCQGGFCSPRVMEILARELGKDWTDIPYDSTKSYILTEETKRNQQDNDSKMGG